jgi:hypothetical protein
MMEKFKQLLQSKAKEGKFIKDESDLKARLEMVGGMEDVAQEAFGAKIKSLKEKASHPAAPAEKALPKDAQVGKSQEEVPHDSKDIPSEKEESPEHEDSESAEKEVAENKEESDMAKRNKDRKQYV